MLLLICSIYSIIYYTPPSPILRQHPTCSGIDYQIQSRLLTLLLLFCINIFIERRDRRTPRLYPNQCVNIKYKWLSILHHSGWLVIFVRFCMMSLYILVCMNVVSFLVWCLTSTLSIYLVYLEFGRFVYNFGGHT